MVSMSNALKYWKSLIFDYSNVNWN